MARTLGTSLGFQPYDLTLDDVDVQVTDLPDGGHMLHLHIGAGVSGLSLHLRAEDAEVVQRALSDGLMEARIRRARADGECICNGGDLPAFDHDATCPRSEEVAA